MKYLGVNLANTGAEESKTLRDGGTALVCDDTIQSVILEERVSREKRRGGYSASLVTTLQDAVLNLSAIDVAAISTCCEPLPAPSRFTEGGCQRVFPINHHLSHAIGTFALSHFEDSIVVVADAGGNTYGNGDLPWWHQEREQSSYYLATRNGIELIGRDFYEPLAAGFGEVYRAFTSYLGWRSSQHAGKTMALAAYGNPARFADMPIFSFSDGHLSSFMLNNPPRPLEMVASLLARYGISDILPREAGDPVTDLHAALAAWVQLELERALIKKIEWLLSQANTTNICLSGGVAYNCKMNGEISRRFGSSNVFVQPASGDHGQCLGNAITASYLTTNKISKFDFNPYLGKNYPLNEIWDTFAKDSSLKIIETDNVTRYAAELLAKGAFVCRYVGRSEFGPRALGNRSILGDPREAKNKFAMNKVKQRDPFMPFAPSVLAECAKDFFHDVGPENYMTTAVETKWDSRKHVPSIVHKNGTSRIHIVKKQKSMQYHELIAEFYRITGIPMIMNTSFNRCGEPIVESPWDAIACFKDLPVDYLLTENHLYEKIDKSQVISGTDCSDECITAGLPDHDTLRSIEATTGRPTLERSKFNLHCEFIKWLHYGRKTTTIRYKETGIDFSSSAILPMYETQDFALNVVSTIHVGDAEIQKVVVKRFDQLTGKDALNDGFASLGELKSTLRTIYNGINNNSFVTIYHIYLNTPKY